MKCIEVVAAIIVRDDKILCVQRNENKYDYISLKYEFPGGKVESGETNEEALRREIKEELDLDIKIDKKFLTVDHSYPDFKLTMHSFLCTAGTNAPLLKEHVAYQWLEKNELERLDWAAADLPIVEQLIEI